MSLRLRIAAAVMLLGAEAVVLPEETSAQEIDFGKVDKFESLASGTLHVGAPPKTIVDDGERHVVILTIWDADAETKVYWRSSDGNAPRTTVIPGRGVQTFETLGEFKLEAVGEPNHEVQYGYVLLGLRKWSKKLAPGDHNRWLSNEPDPMRMLPISTRVNKPENDDPSIIEPIELATSAA
jgi:hypothetical protein